VKLRRQLSPSQQRPLLSNFLVDEDDSIIIIDDDVTFGRNRYAKTWNKLIHEDELSDNVKLRLALARMKAMAKYQETWG
jgi:hypothetical protein